MAFIPVPRCARAELRYTAQSQQCMNTLWFEHADIAPDQQALSTLASVVYDWWVDQLAPITSQSVELREVYVLAQDGGGNEFTLAGTPPGNAGGAVGAPLPNNVTLCVSFRTGLAGRSYRGRNYPVGILKDNSNGNYAESDYANLLQEAYHQLSEALIETDWTWVVATRYSNNAPRIVGAATPVIAVVVTDFALDSQRRRLVGRGT